MADGDRGVLLQQHECHGLADDVAAPDHHRVFALELVADALQHLHAAVGRAGPETGHAGHERACAGDVEAVDVLGRRDRLDDLLRLNVRGQRKLHQDAVDGGVGIECIHARKQCCLGHGGGPTLQHRVHAGVFTGLDLVAHVNLRGLVVANQDHGQPGCDAFGLEGGHARGDIGAQLAGEGVAVDQLSGHGVWNAVVLKRKRPPVRAGVDGYVGMSVRLWPVSDPGRFSAGRPRCWHRAFP
ncbi:hypothetical protein D9M69_521450 [compost metagenome]